MKLPRNEEVFLEGLSGGLALAAVIFIYLIYSAVDEDILSATRIRLKTVSKTPSDEDIAIEWHRSFEEPEDFCRSLGNELSMKPLRRFSTLILSDSEDSQMETDKARDEEAMSNISEAAASEPLEPPRGTGSPVAYTSGGYLTQDFEDIPIQLSAKSKLKEEDVVKYIAEMKRRVAAAGPGETIFPSNAACRFELPIDARTLRDETPLSYVLKYCVVSDNRRAIYAKKFATHCQESGQSFLNVTLLQKLYENSFKIPVLKEELAHMTRLLDLDRKRPLDADAFVKISCLMERVILKSQKRGPADAYAKNYIEEADFSALRGKLGGIDMPDQLYGLLEYLKHT